jgi:hypothetical protein
MNIESKSKWQIRLATLSIFLLGFIVGAFAFNAYYLWSGAAKQLSRYQRYDEAFNRLGLNDAQRIEVQRIVGETREKIQRLRQEGEPRMQEIRAQSDEQLQRVLTPEQWQEFQQARDEIRRPEKQNSTGK